MDYLKSKWVQGRQLDSIIALDVSLAESGMAAEIYHNYGGKLICESCSPAVIAHILKLHNDSLITEVEYESKLESAVSKITEKDRDNICDIVWWLKGYKKGAGDSFETCEFHQHHLDTLDLMARTLREILNEKKEPSK